MIIQRRYPISYKMLIFEFCIFNVFICRSFARNLETYKMLTRLKPPRSAFDEMGRGLVS